MKLAIYSYKDNALGAFTNPFYDDRPVEHVATGVTRAIVASSDRSKMSHKVLYKIGEFEDTTGVITSTEIELVVDCDEVIARLTPGA